MRAARPSHLAISKMVAAMVDSPKSIEDLVEVSGLCVTTVRHYVLTLRKEKAVRIAEWQPDRRSHLSVAAYQVGSGSDVVRKRVTPSDITTRWKAWEERRRQLAILKMLAGEQPRQVAAGALG